MIDHQTVQRILDAADIVDVVKEFVTLRKAGVNYKGLCPFHHEKTPSFTVSPAKQVCKCFSCGKGGNAVNFLMQLEQMTYPEALKWLAKKYHIEVKEKELTDEEKQTQNERESMFALNEWVNQYFQDTLHNNVDGVAKGLGYFRQRGFRDEIIHRFHLGFSPEQPTTLPEAALAHGFTKEYLTKTGVCYEVENGKLHDRFHGRVIFPVYTVSGKVVAFGGRILSSEKKASKYVNSPESLIYNKSNELYGLYQGKNAIVKEDCCYLVEGYTDVISMHQCGIENVVASSGTSLTEGQIRLLHRFTNHITVLYDGDAAGIKASLRGIDMLLAEGLTIKVLLLPDGEDPDSFARKHRSDEFRQYIQNHQVDFIKFKTNLLQNDAQGDPIKRAELISDVVKSVSYIPNDVVRQMYITECAQLLSVTESLIVNELNKQLRQRRNGEVEKPNREEQAAADEIATKEKKTDASLIESIESKEERLLITIVIRYGNLPMTWIEEPDGTPATHTETEAPTAMTIPVAKFILQDLENDGMMLRSARYRQILMEAVEQIRQNPSWSSLPYFRNHPDASISQLACELGEDLVELSTNQRAQYVEVKYRLEEVVPRILHDFKHAIIKEKLNELLAKLRDPQLMSRPEEYEALMKEYMEFSAIERQIAQLLGDRIILR